MHTNYVDFVDTNSNITDVTTAEFLDVVEDIKNDELEKVEEKTKMGHVDCGKLYLRTEPSPESETITVLNKGEELMIVSEDNEEWYGVYTAAGQEGFCKKEFIKVD